MSLGILDISDFGIATLDMELSETSFLPDLRKCAILLDIDGTAYAWAGQPQVNGSAVPALTQTSLSIPVLGGQMALGTWQGIYLFEHRSAAMRRSVVLQLLS